MPKVADLIGDQLDYWVGKALGHGDYTLSEWCPSRNWTQGGLIIERERISSLYVAESDPYPIEDGPWSCGYPNANVGYTGPTPLIAAMRCYVASKFGEEVPDEL